MEIVIALVVIAAVVVLVVRGRRTFSSEIERAKRIRRANGNGR